MNDRFRVASHQLLANVATCADIPLIVLDIGARGGMKSDLRLVAPVTECYLFEPDVQAFRELRDEPPQTEWRTLHYVNAALGASAETFSLNLYRKRGCSSRYSADAKLGDLFSRGAYYVHEGTAIVPAHPLDELVASGKVPPPHFVKIDVQGMESDVFYGSQKCLQEHIVGLRVEVSFYGIYRDQPLFPEIDQQLRAFGFVPMHWLEFHEWRRCTRQKFPATIEGPIPASRGQMMHADVLYLLHPESLPNVTEEDKKKLVRLALFSACFNQFDHAVAAFSQPGVAEFVKEKTKLEPIEVLAPLSRKFARLARHKERMAWISERVARAIGLPRP